MASKCTKEALLKGNTLLVTVEDAIDDVLLVCYNNGATLYRGALLADGKRNMPFGVNVPRNTISASMAGFNSDEMAVLSPSQQASVKPEISGLHHRHTYSLDPNICRPEDRLSPQKDIFCPMRNKGARPMRLRPTKVYCVNCKEKMINSGKPTNSTVSSQSKEPKKTVSTEDKQISDTPQLEDPVEHKSSPMIKISFASPKGQDTIVKIPPKPQKSSSVTLQETNHPQNLDHHQYRKLKRAFKKAKMEVKRAKRNLVVKQTCKQVAGRKEGTKNHINQENNNKYNNGTFSGLQPKVVLSKNKACWKSQLSQSNNEEVPGHEAKNVKKGRVKAIHVESNKEKVSGVKNSDAKCKGKVKVAKSRTAKPSKGLTLVIQTRPIDKVLVGNVSYRKDDVAWGKIQGFPWWPCQVLQLMEKVKDSGVLISQLANVTWFGSSTFSQVACSALRPFREEFNLRYNKKKKGAYRNAVQEACKVAKQQYPSDISFDLPDD